MSATEAIRPSGGNARAGALTTGFARAVPAGVRFAVRGPEALAAFNNAGVLAPADVHAARTLTRLCGDDAPELLLAAALAVRAPRLQHVCVDLARVRDTVTIDETDPVDVESLPWPASPAAWRAAVAASRLVAEGRDTPGDRPLRLVGDRLYLDRYWRYEQRVLADLTARAKHPAAGVDRAVLRSGLDRLFGPPRSEPDLQRVAAAAAVLGRLTVIAGGPGTGKTRTVSRVLALLADQTRADGAALPRVALAAPTGKAAQRMEESLAGALGDLDVDEGVRDWLLALDGVTLHRLLRRHPGSRTRFRHHATNPLPHDVVIVDETSMASLSLVAKLLDAVRDDARLVLVGDPEQLASVEAGSVLGDLVGPAVHALRLSAGASRDLAAVTGEHLAPAATEPDSAGAEPGRAPGAEAGRAPGAEPARAPGTAAAGHVADRIVVLQRGYRFRAGIAELALAVQVGDADAVCGLLDGDREDVRWIRVRAEEHRAAEAAIVPVRARVAAVGAELVAAARRGDAPATLAALDRFRVLCAHRRGPFGVAAWVPLVERWLAEDVDGFDAGDVWYLGRPVLVTRNDYQIGVLNGDVGVAVAGPGGLEVAFRKGGDVRRLSPTRLEHVETVHAMTVHKAQGSEFADVVVVLPAPDSPILTRELFYTAVTRAHRAVTVVGDEDAVRAAVGRRIQRASGLRDALWDPSRPA